MVLHQIVRNDNRANLRKANCIDFSEMLDHRFDLNMPFECVVLKLWKEKEGRYLDDDSDVEDHD